MAIEIGIDTGGTFTDAVVYDNAAKKVLGWAKALTTKEDLSIGIGNALDGLPHEYFRKAGLVSLSTTLATNACVEGKGGRAKLLFIGDNRKAVTEYGGEYGLPAAEEIWFLMSRGTMQGDILEEPDWDAFLRASVDWFRDASAVAVVELFAMWNNAALEKKAGELISREYGIPVICGHELFSGLNSLQRAAGTLLNARLIPIIEDFLKSARSALTMRGISAPVVIVRSDGSVMSEGFTAVRPVETLLCGPAASVKGGMELAGEADCLIVDMGGTTTDIAIVKGGMPKKASEGISIGSWRTFVTGVFIETFGLGGDSAVRFGRSGSLMLGPERILPLSAAAASWPAVTEKLRDLVSRVKRHTEPLHEFYCLVRAIRGNEGYTQEERAFCEALEGGPLILQEAAEAVGRDAYSLDVRRLEREGVVIRCGLTPTDVMHIRGDFERYDRQAALLGAEFAASCMDMTVDELCEAVYGRIGKMLYSRIVRLLLEDRQPEYLREGLGSGLEALIARCWEDARGGNGGGFLETCFRTPAVLVGVGAPIHIFLPEVAHALGTRCVIPANAGVANALGAVVGNISVTSCVKIAVDYAVEGIRGYIVHGKFGTYHTQGLEEAVEAAREDAERSAVEEARLRGAVGDVSVSVEVIREAAHTKDRTEVLLGVSVEATAKGSVAL